MVTKFARTVAMGAALSLALPTATFAQTNYPPVKARWRLPQTGTGEPKQIQINYALPPNCDQSTFRAIDAWNATGSRFKYVFGSWTDQRRTSTEFTDAIIIEDYNITDGTLMRTISLNTYWRAIPERYDADIEVNGNIFWYASDPYGEGDFRCEYNALAGKYDYQSIIGHELGHAGGLGHGEGVSPTRPCQMFYQFARGEARRVLCAGEAGQWRDMYDYSINPY